MGRGEKGALLPHVDSVVSPQKKRSTASRVALLVLLAIFTSSRFTSSLWVPRRSDLAAGKSANISCPSQPPALDVGPSWVPSEDGEFVKLALGRLQGAIRIPTQSFDDMRDPGDDDRYAPFDEFGLYLEETFPLIHDKLRLEKVNTYGRLYTWQGTDEKLKPILLMAHQDVVPVNPDTISQWTHPPFDAEVDEDGWIWGRGSTDCKNTLIASLTAIEKLLSEDFSPERTILISFGFDEEIGGHRGAAHLAQAIEARYGTNGVALVFDEGFTGVDEAFGTRFVRFGLAEKGAISLQLTVLTPGGHSSVPPKHTGLGILARLLVELEANPAKVKLEGNPLLNYLNCAVDYGTVPEPLKSKIRNKKAWKKLGEDMAEEDPILRAFLATTQAVDIAHGGIKINALPEYATASINYRLDFHGSSSAHFSRIATILRPIVDEYNLTFSVNGSHPDATNNVVKLDVVGNGSSIIEPAPVTPTDDDAWALMGGTAKAIWEDAILAPSAMIANTDTKFMWSVSRNIYRFAPASLELLKNFHTVNERMHVDAHLSSIRFYYKLLRNTDGWNAL